MSTPKGSNVGYRGYDAQALTPLFPFGYGLSYTTFGFSNLTVAPRAIGRTDVTVAFTVTNLGDRAGSATPQVYVRFPPASGEPPRQLKAFDRLELPSHASQRVVLTLPAHGFDRWSAGRWSTDAGDYVVSVGRSSRDLPLSAPVTLPASNG